MAIYLNHFSVQKSSKLLQVKGRRMMFTTTYIVVIVCLLKVASAAILVQTNSGPVEGVSTASEDVEAFLGIPYAESPVGDLRFEKPVSKPPWTKTLHASKLPPPCSQASSPFPYDFLPDITNMSEDCLYLNMWTPHFVSNDTLNPVVIFFHHGGFTYGSSSMDFFDGTHLSRRGKVVVVTVNYRLGAFGFFLADPEVAGNMGIYDQIMAVKWVKDNALHFGGDPENIILMGVSAGAIAVGAFVVSPITKDLFHKAIIHSGGIALPFLYDNTRLSQASKQLAAFVGCANKSIILESDPKSVVSCLKNEPANSIVNAQKVLINTNPLLFYPRINDEFLPESTIQMLRKGEFNNDIPVLTGINHDEGPFFLTVASPEYFGVYGKGGVESLNKNLVSAIARSVMSFAKVEKISEVLDFYLSHVKDRSSLGYTRMLADMVGDFAVACSTVFQADIFSLKGNHVHFFRFGYRSPSTPNAEWFGTTHLDELQYIFGNPMYENFTGEEIELSNRLMDRWSTFARTGNPNIPGQIPWLRYSYHNQFYLSVDQEEESIRMKPLDRCNIWRKNFKTDIDSDLIRFLRNSGLHIVNKNVTE